MLHKYCVQYQSRYFHHSTSNSAKNRSCRLVPWIKCEQSIFDAQDSNRIEDAGRFAYMSQISSSKQWVLQESMLCLMWPKDLRGVHVLLMWKSQLLMPWCLECTLQTKFLSDQRNTANVIDTGKKEQHDCSPKVYESLVKHVVSLDRMHWPT